MNNLWKNKKIYVSAGIVLLLLAVAVTFLYKVYNPDTESKDATPAPTARNTDTQGTGKRQPAVQTRAKLHRAARSPAR